MINKRSIAAAAAIAGLLAGSSFASASSAVATPTTAGMTTTAPTVEIPQCAVLPEGVPAANAQSAIVRPRIVGNVRVGGTVHATNGKWPFRAGTFLSAWYRIVDGQRQYICDGYEYTLTARDKGYRIVARVIALSTKPLKNNGVAWTPPRLVK